MWVYQPIRGFVGNFLKSFQEFPQRQKSATLNIGNVLKRMESTAPSGR
jgi:hypothetical protein